jgi:hypothetical protein
MSGDIGAYDPEGLRRRAAHFIAKPFLAGQLANILRLVIQGVPADLLPSGGMCQG